MFADMGYQIDNMEGLSVHRTAAGDIMLTLISDDNFSFLQRTHAAAVQADRGVRLGSRGLPRELLADLALEIERPRRQFVVLRLDQEGIETAAVIDGLERVGRTRSLTERPSASEIMVTFSRLGRKRRLVLMFEWLTLWPT